MKTPIHTSLKLEKLIRKKVQPEKSEDISPLGKWNATVFNFDRKKSWLIINSKTQYNLILTNITAQDLSTIEDRIKSELHQQLNYDGIEVSSARVNEFMGDIEFLPTDNDRRANGFLNHHLFALELWKAEYGKLDLMPMNELINRLNRKPMHIGKGHTSSDYSDSISEMRKVLGKD